MYTYCRFVFNRVLHRNEEKHREKSGYLFHTKKLQRLEIRFLIVKTLTNNDFLFTDYMKNTFVKECQASKRSSCSIVITRMWMNTWWWSLASWWSSRTASSSRPRSAVVFKRRYMLSIVWILCDLDAEVFRLTSSVWHWSLQN